MFYKTNKKVFHIDAHPESFMSDLENKVFSVQEDAYGWNLVETEDFDTVFEIFGDENRRRIQKVKNKFIADSTRKLGVVFAGEKGMGKSLALKKISSDLQDELNLPIILIDGNMRFDTLKGVFRFIKKGVFIFDEFEKNFTNKRNSSETDDRIHQDKLLSLLDGIDDARVGEKKLFLFSVNDTLSISPNLINRPSRIRYNFFYQNLDTQTIKEYFQVKLNKGIELDGEVYKTLTKIGINFDVLQVIVEELNGGFEFNETIQDLGLDYKVILELKYFILSDGRKVSVFDEKNESINIVTTYMSLKTNDVEIFMHESQVSDEVLAKLNRSATNAYIIDTLRDTTYVKENSETSVSILIPEEPEGIKEIIFKRK